MRKTQIRRVGLSGSTSPRRASIKATTLSGSAGAIAGRGLVGASDNGNGNSKPATNVSQTGRGFDDTSAEYLGRRGGRFY